uniref:DUF6240 domain-containing protein n=1 Tax=Agathobacter sp. TaxID=2021311 RepID=UPI004056D7B1
MTNMYIDQTKAIQKYLQNSGVQSTKASGANPADMGKSVLDYGKTQESYRMTEGGSYFMPDAVYTKPEREEEKTAVEQLDSQMDMSAESRRDQMAVVANTTSAEDLKEMEESGFSVLDEDSRTVITVIDEIKGNMAKMGADVSGYGDELSEEQLEAITGSQAAANQISSRLSEADLPDTKENLEEVKQAYETAAALGPLTDEVKAYLIRNGYEPTIRNLYMAQYSAVNVKNWDMRIDFSSLEKQLQQVIKDANLAVTEETMAECKWLVQQNIELNVSTLTYLDKLNTFSMDWAGMKTEEIDDAFVLKRIIEAMQDGKRPMDAYLMEGFSYMDKAKFAMDVVANATDEDVAYCVSHEMRISIESLSIAEGNRKEASSVQISVEMESSISFVTAKRRLEETRLAMTLEANYSLLKRGIAIDTKPLEQLVEDLKNQENRYYKDLMAQNGVEATSENISVFSQTTRYVEELKYQPAYILNIGQQEETILSLHESGSSLKSAMDKALQSYETLWTAPRKDMGDSIRKAFQNVDEILKDLGLEETKANQRAVRILAYNRTEITAENILNIKDKDMQVQKLFDNLTPAVTLEMIRRGENPLEMEITQLNELTESIQAEMGEKETERFSKFLWKLEKNNEITQEERDSYIGIYRLIAQVEKTDGAVIGALVNQGADITMKNLLSAVRTGKKSMNYTVDDNFEGVNGTIKGAKIDEQILASYQADCVNQVMDSLSPETLSQVKNWETMTPEQMMEALQDGVNEQEMALEQQYHKETLTEYTSVLEASDDVYAYLEKYDIKNSTRNVMAVSRLLENPSNVFEVLFATENKSNDYKKMIADMKNTIMHKFGEAVKTPEEMAEAQETLAETAERAMQTMIIENEPVSVKDIHDLRLMSRQFMLCSEKAKEESYLVPVATGDSVTGVSLKIVRGKENKGFVDIFFRGALKEKVAASFEAKENGISGMIAATDEETRKLFAENLGLLAEKMQGEGKETLDIRVAKVEDLSMWQFEKNSSSETGEKNPVQTKRLYHIAESFIQTMEELVN